MKAYTAHLFMALGTAFHFTDPPPDDILDPRYLERGDPDEVLAAVLAHAQIGSFAPTDRLVDLMKREDDALVWIGCRTLLAYAAPARVLRRMIAELEGLIDDDPCTAWWISAILGTSGCLWAAPEILRLHTRVQDRGNDRWVPDSPPLSLSAILEAEMGEIASGPSVVPQPDEPPWFEPEPVYDHEAYHRLVCARIDEVRARCPEPEHDALFGGELRDLRRIATRLLERLRTGSFVSICGGAEIEDARMILEASTGVDLRGFFCDTRLQTDEAIALVEELLRTGTLDRFRPGARYFFGHEIAGGPPWPKDMHG
jgi:hypothetical protein